jgi:CRP-like cAMP-binding protein
MVYLQAEMVEDSHDKGRESQDSEQSNLFTSLDADDRRFLLEQGVREAFRPGDVILREGELGDSFYLLVRGEVEVSTESNGKVVKLATLTKGAVFGEVPALSRSRRTATVTAKTSAGAVRFDNSALELLLMANPKLRERLEALVLGRAQSTIEKIFGEK